MGDEIRITVIATGFGHGDASVARPIAAAVRPSMAAGNGSRPVFAAARESATAHASQPAAAPGGLGPQSLGAQSIRRAGAADRPVRRLGTVVDDGGEPRFKAHADDPSVPDVPQTEFHITEDDETTDYESPAFLRYQAK